MQCIDSFCFFHGVPNYLPSYWRNFGAILASLPVSVTSGNWHWSVNILIYVSVPHLFFSFPCLFLRFFLKKRNFGLLGPFWRHLGATSCDVWWLALISRLSNRSRSPASAVFLVQRVFLENAISAYFRHFDAIFPVMSGTWRTDRRTDRPSYREYHCFEAEKVDRLNDRRFLLMIWRV